MTRGAVVSGTGVAEAHFAWPLSATLTEPDSWAGTVAAAIAKRSAALPAIDTQFPPRRRNAREAFIGNPLCADITAALGAVGKNPQWANGKILRHGTVGWHGPRALRSGRCARGRGARGGQAGRGRRGGTEWSVE